MTPPATTPPVPPAPPPPRAPAAKSGGMSRRALWIAVTAGGIGLLLALWIVITQLPRWLVTPRDQTTPAAADASGSDTRKIHAQLFYVSEDGSELIAVSREVPFGATPSEQARRLIEAQVQAPPTGYVSAIPASTAVRGLYLASKGEAYIDLSGEIASSHTGGSLDETLAVFALVNCLTVNLADVVTSVQILVDGRQVDTLAGHVDLRRPLKGSLKWVRKEQEK